MQVCHARTLQLPLDRRFLVHIQDHNLQKCTSQAAQHGVEQYRVSCMQGATQLCKTYLHGKRRQRMHSSCATQLNVELLLHFDFSKHRAAARTLKLGLGKLMPLGVSAYSWCRDTILS